MQNTFNSLTSERIFKMEKEGCGNADSGAGCRLVAAHVENL
jgi:hypothetical protein